MQHPEKLGPLLAEVLKRHPGTVARVLNESSPADKETIVHLLGQIASIPRRDLMDTIAIYAKAGR